MNFIVSLIIHQKSSLNGFKSKVAWYRLVCARACICPCSRVWVLACVCGWVLICTYNLIEDSEFVSITSFVLSMDWLFDVEIWRHDIHLWRKYRLETYTSNSWGNSSCPRQYCASLILCTISFQKLAYVCAVVRVTILARSLALQFFVSAKLIVVEGLRFINISIL